MSDSKQCSDGVLCSEDIKKIIPHRYPFLMIDRIEEMSVGKSCIAYKNVTNNEWFFQGHFPNHAVFPGVLIIEAMAQAAGVLAFKTLISEDITEPGKSDIVYFTSIENAKFRKPVMPGDVIKMQITIEQRHGNKFWRFSGKAFVSDNLVSETEFKAMIPEI